MAQERDQHDLPGDEPYTQNSNETHAAADFAPVLNGNHGDEFNRTASLIK